ncbi:hypothetical protein ES332_D02G090400v1 [Gossypium tomentosum]|uniref:Uncharacterized protein n=1 Tax=Gossypium tomentosum TaxID=34277 RepID=A0A5D2LUX1_GOSTO|nr:hypothetical protein ES332_D02G090400v1 [Gossypium tomentosum]
MSYRDKIPNPIYCAVRLCLPPFFFHFQNRQSLPIPIHLHRQDIHRSTSGRFVTGTGLLIFFGFLVFILFIKNKCSFNEFMHQNSNNLKCRLKSRVDNAKFPPSADYPLFYLSR